MTQMQDAFAKAGYGDAEEWPSDRLRKIAQDAMIAHADNTLAAQRAIFEKCCPGNSLARALFLPWFREATAALLAEERRLLKAAQHSMLNERQQSAFKVIALTEQRAEAAAKEARQRALEERARQEQERGRLIDAWLQNKARNETIDGRHWWEVSPNRLRQFARRINHRSKFWQLVIERVPAHDDIRPISHYMRPDEVNALWDEAWGNESEE